jgi:DNA-binding transcriptional regulator YdaS (Cro superfamily)
MYKKLFCNFLGLILVVTASTALAQGQAYGAKSGGFQEQFFQIKRRQLGPVLGVSQQTVDQLLQIEQRYQAMRQKLFHKSRGDFQHLMQVMSQPSPSDQEVKPILNNIRWSQQEKLDLQHRQGQEEEKLLTPVQMARKIMYQKRLLREARSIKGRDPRATAPLTPPSGPREVQVSRKTRSFIVPSGAYQEKESDISGQQPQLQKALGVKQQTVTQLIEIRDRYRPLRQKLIGEAKEELQRLEQAINQPNPSEPEVKACLNNIRKKEQEMQSVKQRQDEEEMAILSPVQQGRYLVFLISLRHQMVKQPRRLAPPTAGGMGTRPAGNATPGRFPAAPPPTSPSSPAYR